ncbi:VanZ family protein [Gaetbulibacter aestuarii]|uniref:VanZ family protein n=1 Tax=Gaetbulibacter aestuarii TaxID=1502358 RepID=A0ABW7N331_9FLAO
MLNKGLFVFTLSYTIALLSVSLMRLTNVPDLGVDFGDKIFHFCAYVVLSMLWFYTCFRYFNLDRNKALTIAVLGAIIFGIIIEVLQKVLTDYRAFEIYDALANTLGALLTAFIMKVKAKKQVKKI